MKIPNSVIKKIVKAAEEAAVVAVVPMAEKAYKAGKRFVSKTSLKTKIGKISAKIVKSKILIGNEVVEKGYPLPKNNLAIKNEIAKIKSYLDEISELEKQIKSL